MSLVSAQDATATWDCKTGGCSGTARVRAGAYAYLCDQCRDRKVAERRTQRTPAEILAGEPAGTRRRAGGAASLPVGVEAATGLVDAVRALERPAKLLENAQTRRRVARAEAGQALAEFQQGLQAVRQMVERLLI